MGVTTACEAELVLSWAGAVEALDGRLIEGLEPAMVGRAIDGGGDLKVGAVTKSDTNPKSLSVTQNFLCGRSDHCCKLTRSRPVTNAPIFFAFSLFGPDGSPLTGGSSVSHRAMSVIKFDS